MITGEKIPETISKALRPNLQNRDKVIISQKTGYSVPTINNLLYGITNVTRENKIVVSAMIDVAKNNALKKKDLSISNLKILTKV